MPGVVRPLPLPSPVLVAHRCYTDDPVGSNCLKSSSTSCSLSESSKRQLWLASRGARSGFKELFGRKRTGGANGTPAPNSPLRICVRYDTSNLNNRTNSSPADRVAHDIDFKWRVTSFINPARHEYAFNCRCPQPLGSGTGDDPRRGRQSGLARSCNCALNCTGGRSWPDERSFSIRRTGPLLSTIFLCWRI